MGNATPRKAEAPKCCLCWPKALIILVTLIAIQQLFWRMVLSKPDKGVILHPTGRLAETPAPLRSLAKDIEKSPAKVENSAVRILNLNACVLPRGVHFSREQNDRKQERLKEIFDQFIKGGYDIGIYQEIWESVFCKELVADFYKMFQKAGFYVAYSPLYKWTYNSGNVIVSKYPITRSNLLTYVTSSGWQKLMPNGVLHARVLLPDGNLIDVYNTHQHSDNKPGDHWLNFSFKEIRRKQSDEFLEFAKETNPGGNLFIYAGDWNVTGGTTEYNEMVNQIGYRSNLEKLSVASGKWPATLNGQNFMMRGDWVDHSDVCLDHAFSNGKFKDTKVISEWDISDHFAVETTLVSLPDLPRRRSIDSQDGGSRINWRALAVILSILLFACIAYLFYSTTFGLRKEDKGKENPEEDDFVDEPTPRDSLRSSFYSANSRFSVAA